MSSASITGVEGSGKEGRAAIVGAAGAEEDEDFPPKVAVGKKEGTGAVPMEASTATAIADPDLAATIEVTAGVAVAADEPCSPKFAIWHDALLISSPEREARDGELEGGEAVVAVCE